MGKNVENSVIKEKKRKSVSYSKWGYVFVAPFFISYIVWSLVPQLLTFIYSFFKIYTEGRKVYGPKFVGIQNYIDLFSLKTADGIPNVLQYTANTMIMWFIGVVPQFLIALLLAVWFTNYRLNIKGQGFFKTVMYMPNLIMASAFAMLIWTLFSTVGPINGLLQKFGWINAQFDFFGTPLSARCMVAGINFLMWFGNTTIVLMAGIMGIDGSLFEAAMIDGASGTKVFFKVTLPLLMPIITYAVITSLIGGINMYDVPYILTNRSGGPNVTTMTLIMAVQRKLNPSKSYGDAGALSVLIFIFSAAISFTVYYFFLRTYKDEDPAKAARKKMKKVQRGGLR